MTPNQNIFMQFECLSVFNIITNTVMLILKKTFVNQYELYE